MLHSDPDAADFLHAPSFSRDALRRGRAAEQEQHTTRFWTDPDLPAPSDAHDREDGGWADSGWENGDGENDGWEDTGFTSDAAQDDPYPADDPHGLLPQHDLDDSERAAYQAGFRRSIALAREDGEEHAPWPVSGADRDGTLAHHLAPDDPQVPDTWPTAHPSDTGLPDNWSTAVDRHGANGPFDRPEHPRSYGADNGIGPEPGAHPYADEDDEEDDDPLETPLPRGRHGTTPVVHGGHRPGGPGPSVPVPAPIPAPRRAPTGEWFAAPAPGRSANAAAQFPTTGRRQQRRGQQTSSETQALTRRGGSARGGLIPARHLSRDRATAIGAAAVAGAAARVAARRPTPATADGATLLRPRPAPAGRGFVPSQDRVGTAREVMTYLARRPWLQLDVVDIILGTQFDRDDVAHALLVLQQSGRIRSHLRGDRVCYSYATA